MIIDVRGTEDYESEHIPGVVNYPLTVSTATKEDLEIATDNFEFLKIVILTCQSGVRSQAAAETIPAIIKEGETCRIFSLIGGYDAWKEAGYETACETKH